MQCHDCVNADTGSAWICLKNAQILKPLIHILKIFLYPEGQMLPTISAIQKMLCFFFLRVDSLHHK